MLVQLLSLLERHPAGLDFVELCRALQAPPGLVAAMLDTLVRKGRLRETGPDGGACTSCGVAAGCQLLALRGKRYHLKPPLKATLQKFASDL
jgi:hypothetical protein